MTRSQRRKLSRRQFIKSSAAVGLAATLPTFLSGCGEQSVTVPGPTPVPAGRERRTLQFDLSYNGPINNPLLIVLNSTSYRAPLKVHDAASRARFRQSTPELNAVADEHLTHYVEDVDLPSNALQLVTVAGTANGKPAILGAYINIPSATLQEYAVRALQGEAALPLALMNQYGTAANAVALGSMLTVSNACVNPLTTAVALCFHHPEVMNLNTMLGANTLIAYIQNLPADCTDPTQGCKYVDPLALWIAEHSPATTEAGGWATVVPQVDGNGKPVVDQNGNQVYRYDLTDDTLGQMARPVQEVLKAVFNDPQYEGSNWNATTGLVSVDQTGAAVAPEDDSFNLQATLPVGSTHNGINFIGLSVVDPVQRSVQLTIKNRYLRWLRAYAQYFTPEGVALPVADPDDDDTSRAKFITEVTSNNQIMGIPLQGNDVSSTNIDFAMPAAASTARIFIGGLGTGGEAFCPEAVDGSALTLAFNIGLPTVLLALGIGDTDFKGISQLVESDALRKIVFETVRVWVAGLGSSYAVGIYGSETSKDAACFLTAAANTIIQALLAGSPLFVQYLAIQEVGQAAAAVPFVGWILKVAEIASALLGLAFTVAEVLESRALTTNDVTLSFNIEVTVNHDKNDFRFPPEADTYEITATLAKSLVYKVPGNITPPGQQTAPIVATIQNVPSSGTVTIDVVLKSSSGAIVAHASNGPVAATPDAAGKFNLFVTNLLIPLTAETQYTHDLELEYQNGAHVWVQTPQAPSATVAALSCSGNDTLCQLSQITISPRTGMLGYGWRTGGLGVGQCGGGSGDVLFTFQNVFAAAVPDSGLKFPGCGFSLPAVLAYDPKGPPSGIGNNFYVEPAANGDGYFLRSVTLDTTTPFDVTPATNWGRFTQALDSIAVLPTGYVVGVASATHKLEVLTLPDSAAPDAMPGLSPWATMRSGKGTRAGLMDTPVAVTVRNGAILVLEQGNRRFQAFDVTANPVPYFAAQTSPFAALKVESSSAVYVDLGCDALGYLFVLSYVNNGATAADYRLDIYDPNGVFITRTTGIAAGRMTVDPFRTVYTLNYTPIAGAPRVEPSASQWIPSTPST